ncbi:MAG: SDR family NAD(P)-dependent oxidoreductase [Pseudomonadota bacterium]
MNDELKNMDALPRIAIVGMACRFPKADDIDQFWNNLKAGRDCVSWLSDEALMRQGVEAEQLKDPHYVRSRGVLEEAELFDAEFFGYSPREATLIDPQQRVFLECAWTAMENAGYDAHRFAGRIGVFAGAGWPSYLFFNLAGQSELLRSAADQQTLLGNDKDSLTTRVAYKLNLTGPAVTIQTACSSSLVAISMACQSLLAFQSDLVLAGGVSILFPQTGYVYRDGGILSKDGRCRAFDAAATGTVLGSGGGVVVLKRYEEAVEDGDYIYAVIRSAPINNDGASKVGYTAPSIERQSELISEAHALANVLPSSITMLEAHGTGTLLGDPVEISALSKAFAAGTAKKQFCALGALKTSIGHLDAAAGVAGLIKAVLSLHHKQLPPTLHYDKPHPNIDFANSPFFVNTRLTDWSTNELPRRAGVSSFGLGGTNAHIILEEPPARVSNQPESSANLLLLSAKTESALQGMTSRLSEFLSNHPDTCIADVAYTLLQGRRAFHHRRFIVCRTVPQAISALQTPDWQPNHRLQTTSDDESLPALGNSVDHDAKLEQLGQQWVHGVDIGCEKWLHEKKGRRIPLPTYPFERERYCVDISRQESLTAATNNNWIRVVAAVEASLKTGVAAALVDRNDTYLDEYCLGYMHLALQQLSAFRPPLNRLSQDDLIRRCGVIPRYHQLFAEMLTVLASHGRLNKEGDTFTGLAQQLTQSPHLSMDNIKESDSEFVNLVQRCGESLSEVFLGKLKPIDLFRDISEGAGRSQAEHDLDAYLNTGISSAILTYLSLLPPDKTLRILEVGGGTGIATASVLQSLPAERTQYLFTDVNPYFVARAKQRFAGQYFVEYGVFDVDQPPPIKVCADGPYDVIIAVNVLHATKKIAATLDHLRSLLVPNGLLLAREITRPSINFLVTYGLLMKPVEDGIRSQGNPFYSTDQWQNALRGQGFANTAGIPVESVCGQQLLIANAAAAEEGNLHDGNSDCNTWTKKANIADWFHIPSWRRTEHPQYDAEPRLYSWLIILDDSEIGIALADRLRSRGHKVFTANVGASFRALDSGAFEIDIRSPKDHQRLIEKVRPERIVHLCGVESSALATPEDFDPIDFYSLLWTAQALGNVTPPLSVSIAVITSHKHNIAGNEVVCPSKSLSTGACRVIPLEYPNIKCKSIDIASVDASDVRLIDRLLNEIESTAESQIVAYRGSYRWTPVTEPLRMPPLPKFSSRLKRNGVYLITGGLGKIGMALGEHLARTMAARLVLTGRSKISPSDSRLRKLEAAGAQVLPLTADVADIHAMRNMLERTQTMFGAIDGVIHSAGVLGDGAIQAKTQHEVASVLRAKVLGTLTLHQLFHDLPLDFFILFSSLSSYRPGFGQVAYSAANNFLESFVHSDAAQTHRFLQCISWDVWQGDGMAYNMKAPAALQRIKEKDFQKRGILSEEGVEVFRRSLECMHPHLMISTSDYLRSNRQDLVQTYIRQMTDPDPAIAMHERPQLDVPFEPSSNQTERDIQRIWEELLGIESIGVRDSFFDLGGDSLIGMQLIGRIRSMFGVNMPAKTIYDHSTIRDLALAVEDALLTSTSLEELDELIAQSKEHSTNHVAEDLR